MSDEFAIAAEAKGHKLKRDEDGRVDIFVCDVGYHNGPGCVDCHDSWCHHCDGPDDIEPCIGKEAYEAKAKEARRATFERLKAEFGE